VAKENAIAGANQAKPVRVHGLSSRNPQ